MIKKKYEIIDVGTDSVGRITCLKILYNNISIVTISVYASAQNTDRCSFFKDLQLYIPLAE